GGVAASLAGRAPASVREPQNPADEGRLAGDRRGDRFGVMRRVAEALDLHGRPDLEGHRGLELEAAGADAQRAVVVHAQDFRLVRAVQEPAELEAAGLPEDGFYVVLGVRRRGLSDHARARGIDPVADAAPISEVVGSGRVQAYHARLGGPAKRLVRAR